MPEVHVLLSGGAGRARWSLTEHAAYQVEEKTEEAEKSDEYQNLLNRLRRDLGVKP